MRILQISSHYNQGGAAKIVACVHSRLQSKGYESYVAYGRGEESGDDKIYRFNSSFEVYLSALLSRLTGLNGWFNRRATDRLLSYIDQINPDLIHFHALHGYYVNFQKLFDYVDRHGIPCVWTFHDCHAFSGNCGYFYECRKWREGCGRCPRIHDYPKSLFFDFTGYMWKRKKYLFTKGKNRVIVTPSDWLTAEARQSFFNKYPCVTIHNGIDTEHVFYPRDKKQCREKHGYAMEQKIVLGIAVGYSDPRKGAKYILQLARDLQDEATVVLVGWQSSDDVMLKGISNVRTVPATENAHVLAEYYSLADVFVLPSLAENYATVTLEAMACGTPVVGFDAGGIPEQLTGNKGIVVETGNQRQFTEAVRKALSEGNGLLRGELLAGKIREDNSLDKMLDGYLKLYHDLIGRNEG